ncbi:MAG: HU family DNA-binding protein [Planctomycetota bacterium]
MNKGDLIDEVQRQLGNECSKAHAERAVNSVLSSIGAGLKQDATVQLVGFGTFLVKERPPRTYRNPRTGEMMEVGPSTTVNFRPGQGLKGGL